MTWKPFYALPNYLGGKRKLCPTIFREIARTYPTRTWPGLSLLDPCAGACSVALYAKAQGMRVIAGDIAERSYIVQQAVIANDAEKISSQDMAGLFEKRNGYAHFVAEHFVPEHFPAHFADFLDLALANIADYPQSKQALLKLALFKMMKAPRIQFSDTTISRAAEEDRLEDLASHKAKMAERWYLTHPSVTLRQVSRAINYAIFANGHENLAHLEDATALTERWAPQVDVLYLDPPYPGVTGYETYHVLDSVFAGRPVPHQRSTWSTAHFSLQLLDLLGKAQEIPLWVISYGSVGTTLGEILGLVEAYRPAEAIVVEYAHLQAIARTEVAEANREFIILAKGAQHAE